MTKIETRAAVANGLREFADQIDKGQIEVLEISRMHPMGDLTGPETITIKFHELSGSIHITSLTKKSE